MSIKVLDGKRFAEMVIQGANHLSANAKYVDSLNVFPVPDGDTGTNMNLSMNSGANEVKKNVQDHIGKVGMSLAKGLLMGARGNSGVILSQLFRGFAKYIEPKSQLNGKEFAGAFEAGVQTAYKAVMKPVEGTILTVAKDAAKRAVEVARKNDDIVQIMEELVIEARASLQRTPDLLPVLKEVGVVDSGGQGLLFIYEGFLAELKGEKLSETPNVPVSTQAMEELVEEEHHKSVQSFMDTKDIKYGYCTEFMVRFTQEKLKQNPFSEEKFRKELSELGDSLLVVADDEIVKVHIHTEQPGVAITYGHKFGDLIKVKVDNMREQHAKIVEEDHAQGTDSLRHEQQKEKLDYGIVTVSMGSGIEKLFRSIGAHEVIEGGQTMNPSTEDIVKAIKEVNAKKVIVLPNNKNIIMTAEQAAELCDEEVVVVPSKTVPQGLAALLAFNPTVDLNTNKNEMTEALQQVKTGQITYAVRDTNIDGLMIDKGDFMGIADGKIVAKDKNKVTASKELLKELIDDEAEILTIFTGEDATSEEINEVSDFVESNFPDLEVEIHEGNQPLYSFIFSVE